jgi:putative membrane protein
MPEDPKPVHAVGQAGIARTAIGGALMGIANIIPGVSGGTMVLAMGLYEDFIQAVADVTRLRRHAPSWVFLGVLLVAAVLGIVAALVPITWGLENHHHLMYALFIGLTLGGVPIVLKELGKVEPAAIAGAVAGLVAMLLVTFALREGGSLPQNFLTYVVAGTIASAAMVLPGISGSYLLLVMGLYLPITRAIKEFARAGAALDFGTAFTLGWTVILPVGLGVLLGIAGLTNGLKALLERARAATLGVLLGLLVGSVAGLYPFGPLVEKGEVIVAAHPITAVNVVLVVVLLVAGLGATQAIGRLGGSKGH